MARTSKKALGAAMAGVMAVGAVAGAVSAVQEVKAGVAEDVKLIHAKIEHFRSSLKKNYLGLKNVGQWQAYEKELKVLIAKLPAGSTQDKYQARLDVCVSLLNAAAKVNHVEKSLDSNFHGIKNAETWSVYLKDGNDLLGKVDKEFEGRKAELVERLAKAKTTVDGIIETHKKDLAAAEALFVAAEKSMSLSDAEKALAAAKKLGTHSTSTELVSKCEALVAKITSKVAVSSVTVLNSKQIKVSFTKLVDKATAETAANYIIKNAADAPQGGAITPVLQADGMSVVLDLATALTNDSSVSLVVKNVQEKNDPSKVIPLYATTLVVADKVAPEVASVESKTNSNVATSVTVKFSEPVTSAVYKINGQTVAAVLAADGLSATISGLALDASKTHSLEVINLTDSASNTAGIISKTFNVVKDVAAPVVSLSTMDDNKIVLKFNKDMNPNTVIAGGNITVKDELLGNVGIAGVTQLDANDKTTFVVTINDATLYNNKTSRNLTVLFTDAVLDSLGNKLGAQTKQVTISKDSVKPAISDITFKKNAAGVVTHLVVKSNKQLKTGTVATAGITVINKDGVNESNNFLAANSDAVVAGSKEVVIPLHATNNAIKSGAFTVALPANLITDDSLSANKNDAFTKVVDFGSAAAGTFVLGANAVTTANNNVLTVNFGTAVKGGAVAGSATDVNNYTLNGTQLPSGTVVTLNQAKDTATITLPANSISKDDTDAVVRITNVQNADGVVVTPYVDTVAIKDNIAPELLSGKILDNKNIILTYSEGMANLANASVGDEFIISQDGVDVVLTAAELQANALSGVSNQIKLTLAKGNDVVGTKEVNTLTVANAASTAAGNITVTFNDGGTPVVKTVTVAHNDAATVVATKIAEAFSALSGYTVTTNGANVVFTANSEAADKAVNVSVVDTDSTGVGTPSSTETAAGVASSSALRLDLNKTITIKAKNASGASVDMKDASTIGNGQKESATSITLTK